MPSISKIRLTNIVYEEGNKRYNDELFLFDGNNGAILLENGGGKTVFIQTALQAILPHTTLAERKIKDTLQLDQAPAHIAIEWITNDNPRRYVTTTVSLFLTKNGLDSYRYVYEYNANDPYRIEEIPFVRDSGGKKRPSDRGEIQDYYGAMRDRSIHAKTFDTIKDYKSFIEEQYHIISSEWESVVKINSSEGGVETFFDDCKTTSSLFDKLLIPTVEASITGHNPNLFADMFEKQRASFYLYKQLKESIEENKRIQHELESYVETYDKLNVKEIHYLKAKKKAKSTLDVITTQKGTAQEGEQDVLRKKEALSKANNLFLLKRESYKILKEEVALRQLEVDYKMTLSSLVEKEVELSNSKRSYYSLKLAKLKKEYHEHQGSLKNIEKEISELDHSDELIDYEDKLEEARRALLGYYLEEMEKFEKEKQELTFELQPIENQLSQLKTDYKLVLEKKDKASIEKQR